MSRDVVRLAGVHVSTAAVTSAFYTHGGARSCDMRQQLDGMRANIRVRTVSARLPVPAVEHMSLIKRAPSRVYLQSWTQLHTEARHVDAKIEVESSVSFPRQRLLSQPFGWRGSNGTC